MTSDDDRRLIADLARDAGDLAARMLADGLTVQHKTSVSDVVTAADHAAEALIVQRLRKHRPDDLIVGEEDTADPDAGTRRTWYIDPVDGTYNFVSGLPIWCAAVALTEPDRDPLGAIYQPTSGELWVGGPDAPTTRNDAPVERLAERDLATVSLATYLHPTTLPEDDLREPLLRVMREVATVRMLGSGSVELASVASGRLGVTLQSDSLPWDWLPGAALVRAAGGAAEIVQARGHRWHVAGNRRAVAQACELLRRG